MLLTPLPLTKLAHASLGVAAVPIGVGLWVDGFAPEPVVRALAAVLVSIGAVVAVRSLRIGVECWDGGVRVRGVLRTRLVPRSSIEEVTSFPALWWRDSAGRRRWTQSCSWATAPVPSAATSDITQQSWTACAAGLRGHVPDVALKASRRWVSPSGPPWDTWRDAASGPALATARTMSRCSVISGDGTGKREGRHSSPRLAARST